MTHEEFLRLRGFEPLDWSQLREPLPEGWAEEMVALRARAHQRATAMLGESLDPEKLRAQVKRLKPQKGKKSGKKRSR